MRDRPAAEQLTVGIDVGGTNIRAGVVDANGVIVDTVEAPTPGSERALEEALVRVVGELRDRHQIVAVGLAVAGFITPDRAMVLFAPHLPWRRAPVAHRMTERLALPVVLEHDANAAAWAEHRFGAAGAGKVVLLVAIGTGIGAALLIDGVLFRGAHGVAPELGHLRMVPDGRACPCGKCGCWERYCSGTGLAATALEMLAADPAGSSVLSRELAAEPGSLTGRRVMRAARDGDRLAVAAVADLARWLGEGLAVAGDIYDPDLIVVGGGVGASATSFLDAAREHYATRVTGAGHRPLARIRTAQMGTTAGIVGAAELARCR
ncbi:MAG: ROK family protein [Mycobacteriaceae bacterium]